MPSPLRVSDFQVRPTHSFELANEFKEALFKLEELMPLERRPRMQQRTSSVGEGFGKVLDNWGADGFGAP